MTPTASPALPSSVTPTMATMPEPTCFFPSSTSPRKSLGLSPWTERASSLMLVEAMVRMAVPALAEPSAETEAPPPSAICFFASASWRSSVFFSSTSALSRSTTSSGRVRRTAAASLMR